MTIQFNGSAVNSVVFNGVTYNNVYMNGVKVLGVVRNLTVGKSNNVYGYYPALSIGSLSNAAGSPIGTITAIAWRLDQSGDSIMECNGTITTNRPNEILVTLNGVTRTLTWTGMAWQASIPYEEAHATLPTSGAYPVEVEVPL